MGTAVRLRRTPPESFAPVLRAARLRAGLGLREAARRIGVTSGYLSALEAGRRCPSRSVAEVIAAALQLDEPGRLVLFAASVTDAGRDHPERSAGKAAGCSG